MSEERGYKLAITGKGGVGKTTLASLLSYLYSSAGRRVIAVDADPDANLGSALGVSPEDVRNIKPIAEMADLIEERTGARPGKQGGMFRLNPRVDDVPDEFGFRVNGIRLLVMGKSKEASAGCYCPENVFLRRLLRHLFVERDDVLIVDMEAGIEHMTRGTSGSVDGFVVVVEPGQRSIQTAGTVRELAAGFGITNVFVVANKVRGPEDVDFIRNALGGLELIGTMSFNPEVVEADMKGVAPSSVSNRAREEAEVIRKALEERMAGGR